MRITLLFLAFIATSYILFITVPIAPYGNFIANEEYERQEQREEIMFSDATTGKMPIGIRAKELQFYKDVFGNKPQLRNSEWSAVGPYNQGGRTRQVAIDIANENNIIAASVSGGIWRSTNGGANWQRVSEASGHMGAISIAQDTRPGKTNIWYAVSGEASGNSASGGGAYYLGDGALKSIDNGATWQPIISTAGGTPNSFSLQWQVTWRIATHPDVDSDRVFIATYGGIYMSTNGGTNWRSVLGNINNAAYYTDIAVSKAGIVYATLSSDGAGTKGFYRSADKGVTWNNITPITLLNSYERTVMAINPNNENEVYFFSYLDKDSISSGGTATSNYKGTKEYISLLKYNYVSGNGTGAGGTWTNLSNNLPNNASKAAGSFDKLNCQGGYDMHVQVQPGTNAVFIAGTNLFRSDNGFSTPNNFVQLGGYASNTSLPNFGIWPVHHPDAHWLVFYPSNPKKIIHANDGGLYLCEDANSNNVTWKTLNNGYLTTQLYTVTLAPEAGSKWLLAGFQDNGNFIIDDYTKPQPKWILSFNGDGAYNYLAPNNEFAVMSIQEGRIGKFKLDENGRKVSRKRIDPIGATAEDYMFINPIAVDPNNNDLLYVPAGKKLFRQNQLKSLPLDERWDSISTGYFRFSDSIKSLNTNGGYVAQISAIAVSKKPANIVYIGTTNKDLYRIDNANTGDPSFTKINKAPFTFAANVNANISSIAIDPDDANKVLVCISNYNANSMYYTNDGGNTWGYCGGNLEKNTNPSASAPSIRAVAILKTPDGGRKYFVGTSIGLYTTTQLKTGATVAKDSTIWNQESINGIGTTVVNHIDVRQSDYVVAVSTHGNGAYISQQYAYDNGLSNITKNTLQIYPNPNIVGDYLRIKASVQKGAQAKIYLVDEIGKLIAVIANKQVVAGENIFSYSTKGLSPGNYFVAYWDDQKVKMVQNLSIVK